MPGIVFFLLVVSPSFVVDTYKSAGLTTPVRYDAVDRASVLITPC